MNEDQVRKCHVCRFCNQSFSNGKKLGGHMRRHLALISTFRKVSDQEVINGDNDLDVSIDDDDDDQIIKKIVDVRKQGMQENDQEIINVEVGLDFDDGDDVMIKKSQQETDVDQDYRANAYVLRENPKKSWRVSNYSKDYGNLSEKKCHSRKESMKLQCVCDKCDKSFNSLKALYGHMRCHSIKRSRSFDESSLMSSSEKHNDGDDDDDEVANPVRKKRSCTRYKSPKRNHHCSNSLSCCDSEVEQGAICLMMLSRGVRSLDEVKLVISLEAEFASSDYGFKNTLQTEVAVGGSKMKKKNKCKVGLTKDVIVETGSSQSNSGRATKLSNQDFENMDTTDSDISLALKRGLKDHNCPISLKEFGSGRAMGCHKRVHNNTERKVREDNHIPDVHRLVNNTDVDYLRKRSTMVTWGSSYSGS